MMFDKKSTVTVRVAAGQFKNLEQVNRVIASTLGKLGHPGCFSGWDIRFDHSINEMHINPKTFEVEIPAGHIGG